MSRPTYVYIIKCMNFMKVGVSWSVEERAEAISSANPMPVEIIEKFRFDSRIAAGVAESAAHEKLKNSGLHVKLEWFHLSEKSLTLAVSAILEEMDRDHEGDYKRFQDIKQIAKEDSCVGTQNLCNHMEAGGFHKEARAFRKSHNGPYCSIKINEDAIIYAESFIFDRIEASELRILEQKEAGAR